MPCMSDGPCDHTEYKAYKDAFCSVCHALEDAGIKIPIGARGMWERHKAQDQARQDQENADKQREKLKHAGLAKLSRQERDALGLR